MENQGKDKNIIITRAFACLMVILHHVSMFYFYSVPLYSLHYKVLALLRFFSTNGVPLFFMISGVLLFKARKLEWDFTLTMRRFLKIFLPLVFFGTVYYIYHMLTGKESYQYLSIYLRQNETHLWYLYSVLPIYTLSSFIRLPILSRTKEVYLFILTIILFFILTEGLKVQPFSKNMAYTFNQAFIWMLLGYGLSKLPHLPILPVISIFFVVYCYTTGLMWSISEGSRAAYLNYSSINVLITSSCLFIMINQLKISITGPLEIIFRPIAKYSLGIYGWHWLFLFILKQYIDKWQLPFIIYYPFLFLGALALSLMVSFIGHIVLDLLKTKAKNVILLIKKFLPARFSA